MIAERKLGPENPDTGGLEEVTSIYFHTVIKTRFYPEEKERDPELHEVAYSLEENQNTKTWEFVRREDFYLDGNLREGGKSYILSEAVTKFEIELLESETALAGGGFKEEWTTEWNSDEKNCTAFKYLSSGSFVFFIINSNILAVCKGFFSIKIDRKLKISSLVFLSIICAIVPLEGLPENFLKFR